MYKFKILNMFNYCNGEVLFKQQNVQKERSNGMFLNKITAAFSRWWYFKQFLFSEFSVMCMYYFSSDPWNLVYFSSNLRNTLPLDNEDWTSFSTWFPGFFGPHPVSYGILLPWPGIKPTPAALEAWSLNYWIAREVPDFQYLSQ